jgi:hypothetical protein
MEDKQSEHIHRMLRPEDGLIVHVNDDLIIPLARAGFNIPMTTTTGEEVFVPLEKVALAGRQGFKFGHQRPTEEVNDATKKV